MKTLLVSDLHGKNPASFIKEKIKEGITKLVCLGDYDYPEILEDILGIDVEKIMCIGNHDYDIVNGIDFYSPLLEDSLEDLRKKWNESRKAKDFVLKTSKIGFKAPGKKKGLKVVERIHGKKVAYVHGTLVDYCSNPFVWGRLESNLSEGRLRDNFREMVRKNYWILFRGHDHVAEVDSLGYKENTYRGKIIREKDEKIKFKKNKRYIVSLNGFFRGNYAIFDNEKKEFQFF